METQIYSYYHHHNQFQLVNIFGYSTRSVPGLEIHGLGKFGRGLKEKIIYLTRIRKLQVPLKRFIICIEMSGSLKELDPESLYHLEFPVLLTYWQLAKLLPLSRLDHCFAHGRVDIMGTIFEKPSILCKIDRDKFPISYYSLPRSLDAAEILANIPGMKSSKLKEWMPVSDTE